MLGDARGALLLALCVQTGLIGRMLLACLAFALVALAVLWPTRRALSRAD